MKENFWPHLLQKPCSRRKGLLQLAQKRLFSGTCGLGRIDFSGSVEGNSGIETSPAPNCLRLLRAEVGCVRRDPLKRSFTGEELVPVVTGEDPLPAVMGELRSAIVALNF